jgi:type I restriction-modification system DNA methylase subunit/restriction endonuclease S subunit
MSIKNFISETFRACLDILRDSEHLTGDKALRPLGFFLQLRLLESKFGKEIDIENYPYDFSQYEFPEVHRSAVLRLVRFSYLANEVKEDNIVKNMEFLWNDILSVHPATKNVFLKGRGFELKKQSTYKKIIDKLASFQFENTDEDILGEAYEEVVKDIMTGKTLGQFFTPPAVKQMMIDLINPQIHPDGTTESVFDPAMGTGGFLITCLRNLLNKSKSSGVRINWDFLTNNRVISGRECEPDTFQLAMSNMLISSGKMFSLEQGDSIRDPITAKYDIVLANPPFGIKGLEYDEIVHPLRNAYMPIKSKSSTPLFLQAIIYMLKINGRCAIVLPEGQDLFSKSKALVAVREYLMKTCDLKEVINLPPGMFTHTSIRTCVFYFYKKKEGSEVLETKIKISSATLKETDRTYVFTPLHQTEKVIFSEFDGSNKRVVVEVGIADIANNSYSLNFAEYISVAAPTCIDDDDGDVVVRTLGDFCKFLPKSKRSAAYGNVSGQYPFFKSSLHVTHFADEADFTEESIIFGDGGEPNVNYGTKFSVSDHCYVLQNTDKPRVNLKYVYYYCLHNLSMIGELFTGAAIKNISKSKIESIRIPFPSIEKQNQTVDRVDFILEICKHTSQQKIQQLHRLNELRFQIQIVSCAKVQQLGDVCKIKCGNHSTKKCNFVESGEYLIIGGGKKPIGNHNEYNCDENTILCASHGTAGFISMYPVKTFLTMAFALVENKQIINKKYLYYFLKSIETQLISLGKGTAQPCISMDKLKAIEIPIPSLEDQKEIVDYCDSNKTLIEQLEKDVDENERFAHTFVQNACKKRKRDTV